MQCDWVNGMRRASEPSVWSMKSQVPAAFLPWSPLSQTYAQVRRALRTSENSKMEWHTRTGSPHCLTDLESAAAGQASTIILLRPEDDKVTQGSGPY